MEKIEESIKEQMLFALEDDNEVMTAALDDEDFDEENKRMNRGLIKKHNKIIEKVNKGEKLTKNDLSLIWDANDMDVQDAINIREHHKAGMELKAWLEERL